MACTGTRIEENVYEGAQNAITWLLYQGTALLTGVSITRFVMTLTDGDGVETTIDTNDVGVDLGASGNFEWDSATATLLIRLGELVPGTIALGDYTAELDYYTATTGPFRVGGAQTKAITVKA